jgi:molybdopterin biosynthesis enzyme
VEEVEGKTGLVLAGEQGSGTLMPASRAHGLAVIPERSAVRAGDLVSYLSFDHLLS